METFAPARDFTVDPLFAARRLQVLAQFDPAIIDEPIRDTIAGFTEVPWCFTLQSCLGHFVHRASLDRHSLAPAPLVDVGPITYRIAYVAFCIENSGAGRRFRQALEGMSEIDPGYIQYGSPKWFWEQHPNSYAVQVEPARFVQSDTAVVDYREAQHLQRVRDLVFAALTVVMRQSLRRVGRLDETA